MKSHFVLLVGLAWWGSCRCTSSRRPSSPPPLAHYAGFEGLVDRMWRKDVDAVRRMAVDLTEGEVVEGGGDSGEAAVARVGAALGFLSLAYDAEEVLDGGVVVAEGCGSCHVARGVVPPTTPEWSHSNAVTWGMWGLVWDRAETPPETGDPLADSWVRRWREPVSPDTGEVRWTARGARVARLVRECGSCHGGDGRTDGRR